MESQEFLGLEILAAFQLLLSRLPSLFLHSRGSRTADWQQKRGSEHTHTHTSASIDRSRDAGLDLHQSPPCVERTHTQATAAAVAVRSSSSRCCCTASLTCLLLVRSSLVSFLHFHLSRAHDRLFRVSEHPVLPLSVRFSHLSLRERCRDALSHCNLHANHALTCSRGKGERAALRHAFGSAAVQAVESRELIKDGTRVTLENAVESREKERREKWIS